MECEKGRVLVSIALLLTLTSTIFCVDAWEPVRLEEVPLASDLKPKKQKRRRPRCKRDEDRVSFLAGNLLYDIFDLHRNLFTWNSYKILTLMFPLVLATRRADKKLHECFYDRKHHKNISQVPSWCKSATAASIGIPMAFFGLRALVGNESEEFNLTTRFFWLGIPFVIWSKTLIKKLQFEACRRPWNEHFSGEDRSYGGFPSGHMAEAVYAATLYGLRLGYKYAVPMSSIAWGVGIMFTVCNRHYFSQIVAGAGLGLLYAFAANKTIESRISDRMVVDASVTPDGSPSLSLSYSF